jgi:hypothetical protein
MRKNAGTSKIEASDSRERTSVKTNQDMTCETDTIKTPITIGTTLQHRRTTTPRSIYIPLPQIVTINTSIIVLTSCNEINSI